MRLLLVCILALLIGCDSAPPPEMPPPGPPEPIAQLTLGVGTRYTYAVTTTLSDAGGTVTFRDRDTVQVRVAAENVPLGAYADLLRLDLTATGAPGTTGSSWYRNTTEGLQDVAYQNTTPFSLTGLKTAPVRRAWPFFAPEAGVDTALVIRDSPRLVLQYPLAPETSWEVFDSGTLRQTRTITGTESVPVPAGTFACAVVQTRTTAPQLDDQFIDYIAKEGLILRTFHATSESVGPGGVPTGEVTVFNQRFELIALNTGGS